MMPEGWSTGKISDLIEALSAGVSVNGEDRRIDPDKDELGVLKVSAVSYGVFRPEEHKVILADEKHRVAVFPKKDRILISRANTPALVGASVYIEKDYPHLFLSDKLWQAEPRHNCFSMRWLSYVLCTDVYRTIVADMATGTSKSMKNIAKESFLKIPIDVPPLPEQRRIAAILGTWDRAIRLTEQRIAAQQQRKRALMQHLLTGRRRIREFAGSEWREYTLGELFTERRETGRIDLPLLSITNSSGVVPRDTLERRDTSNEDKSKYLRLCKGDIGYNTMRMWQGVSAVSDLEGIVSPAYTICIPCDKVDINFMGHLFKYPPIIHLFWRYSQGLVDDTLSLKFPNFAKIRITIPERQEQQRIAAVLQTADSELALLAARRAALQRQKHGLMQQLLTGRVRVPLAETHTKGADDGSNPPLP
jgi:type I restriction enzyme S subunit